MSIFDARVCQTLQKEIPCAQQVLPKFFISDSLKNTSKPIVNRNKIINCLPLCPLECNQTIFDTKLSSLKTISWKYYLGLIEKYLLTGFLKLPIKPETAIHS